MQLVGCKRILASYLSKVTLTDHLSSRFTRHSSWYENDNPRGQKVKKVVQTDSRFLVLRVV